MQGFPWNDGCGGEKEVFSEVKGSVGPLLGKQGVYPSLSLHEYLLMNLQERAVPRGHLHSQSPGGAKKNRNLPRGHCGEGLCEPSA